MAVDLTSSNDPYLQFVLQYRAAGTALNSIYAQLVAANLEPNVSIYTIYHALLLNSSQPAVTRAAAFNEIRSLGPQFQDFDSFFDGYIAWVQAQVTSTNRFDNDETIRYKMAHLNSIPRRYMHALITSDRREYQSIMQVIVPGNLYESMRNVLSANKDLSFEDVIYFLYNLSPDKSEAFYIQLMAVARNFSEYIDEKISDFRSFGQNYPTWAARYEYEMKTEAAYLDLIIESQMYMTLYTEMPHNPFETTSQLIRFWTTTEADAIEIFARSQPSIRVPFISYDGEDNVSKTYIYEGDTLSETLPPFDDFIRVSGKSTRPGTIHFTINLSDTKLLPGITNYIQSQFVLKESYVEILVANEQAERIRSILESTFPALQFIHTEVLETRGKLVIQGLSIKTPILLNLTVNQPIFSRYFYIDESEAPVSERKNAIKLRYRSTVMGDEKDESSDKIKSGASLSYTVGGSDTDSPFVEMQIKAREGVREQFLQIVLRVFRFYSLVQSERLAFFDAAVPGGVVQTRLTAVREDNVSRQKVEDINRIIPDMVDYGRACQCKHQPVILADDEVGEWLTETQTALEDAKDVMNTSHRHISRYYQITYLNEEGQEEIEYDMVHFENGRFAEPPPLEGEVSRKVFNVTCSGEHKERPSLIQQMGGERRYPCCNATGTIRKKALVGKADYLRSSGTAKVGQKGTLSSTVLEILREGDSSGDTAEYVRNGMPDPSSSLLHCILTAMQEKTYLSLNPEARINYVHALRGQIANQVTPWAYKQELFDIEAEQIAQNVANPDVPLDPYLYFRGIELYFHINIFVFTMTDLFSQIEVPRTRACHIRVLRREYPTVIIAKLKDNSYCELITRLEVEGTGPIATRYGVISYPAGTVTRMFETEMTTHLYEVLSKSYEAVVLSVGPQIEARLRPFSRPYWMSLFGAIYPEGISGQLIDPYGKTRVVEVTYRGAKIHVSVPPTQPFEATIITQLVSAPEELVVALFGKPYQITPTGFWYPIIDYPDGIYVLTTHSHPPTPNAPLAPIHVGEQSDTRVSNYVRERKQQRLTSILVQVIGWLWHLDKRPPLEAAPPVQGWWEQHIASNPQILPARVENLQLFRKLPTVTSSAEGIAWLRQIWNRFVNSRINLYPSIYDKMLEYFKREEQVVGMYAADPIKGSVDGLYIWTNDFPQHPGVRFFGNSINLEQWRKQTTALHTGKTVSITKIVREVKEEMSEELGPVFLETEDGIYILQNVNFGELPRALALCEHWETHKKNAGRAIEPISTLYTHVQYGLGKNARLLAERPVDGINPASGFYRVVRFNHNFYAALLPLSGTPE